MDVLTDWSDVEKILCKCKKIFEYQPFHILLNSLIINFQVERSQSCIAQMETVSTSSIFFLSSASAKF